MSKLGFFTIESDKIYLRHQLRFSVGGLSHTMQELLLQAMCTPSKPCCNCLCLTQIYSRKLSSSRKHLKCLFIILTVKKTHLHKIALSIHVALNSNMNANYSHSDTAFLNRYTAAY